MSIPSTSGTGPPDTRAVPISTKSAAKISTATEGQLTFTHNRYLLRV